jgi:hypothetical protein
MRRRASRRCAAVLDAFRDVNFAASRIATLHGRIIVIACLLCFSSLSALAGESTNNWQRIPNSSGDQLRSVGNPPTAIMPIFSQLIAFSFPRGFKMVFEKTNPVTNHYTWEAVPDGETIDQWSQMITITGAKGLTANPNLNPQLFLARIAAGFKSACPNTFSAKGFGASKISGYEAFTALAACGTVQSNGSQRSEAAALLAVKGSDDYYTVQWAERGPATAQPIDLSDAKWQDRLKKLGPIKICARVPGEAAPYPSCLAQK